MNIENVINELGLQVFAGADKTGRQVKGAYVSDLLSDVMGKAREGELWITMQTHKNIIAVASLKDLSAILIVNGGRPEEETIVAAEREGVILLGTGDRSFSTCGKLYKMMERDALV
ncbi:MAG: serine kinase [Bacteroidales bacterium]|nr:serine kinase [Bacteroidales bacterium]